MRGFCLPGPARALQPRELGKDPPRALHRADALHFRAVAKCPARLEQPPRQRPNSQSLAAPPRQGGRAGTLAHSRFRISFPGQRPDRRFNDLALESIAGGRSPRASWGQSLPPSAWATRADFRQRHRIPTFRISQVFNIPRRRLVLGAAAAVAATALGPTSPTPAATWLQLPGSAGPTSARNQGLRAARAVAPTATWMYPVSPGGSPPFGFMAWLASSPSVHAMEGLVSTLESYGVVTSPRVKDTLLAVDRGLFAGGRQKHHAYVDSPQPIGYNATISAPHMHAQCLELLEQYLKPGGRALDVGSGTGYLTACFGLMLGEAGKAVGVEHIPELVEESVKNVQSCPAAQPLLESGVIELHAADGRFGWPQHAPYDAIHVGAAAGNVPHALVEQLAVGGRMVIPVGDYFQELRVIDKLPDGRLREFSAADVRYVPLTSKDSQLRGA